MVTTQEPVTTLFDLQERGLKDRIKDLLIKNSLYRDSDEELVAHIWRDEIRKIYGTMNVNVGTFLNDFADYRFTSYETIRRYRQWVQHHNPELKGKKKVKRSKADTEIRRRVITKEL
jgi:hypothetical protein